MEEFLLRVSWSRTPNHLIRDHCDMTIEEADIRAKEFGLFVWIRPAPPPIHIAIGLRTSWEGAIGTEEEIEKLWPGFRFNSSPRISLTLTASHKHPC